MMEGRGNEGGLKGGERGMGGSRHQMTAGEQKGQIRGRNWRWTYLEEVPIGREDCNCTVVRHTAGVWGWEGEWGEKAERVGGWVGEDGRWW
jgi:hypothetical protein